MVLFLDNLITVNSFRFRIHAHHTVHHKTTTLTKLVNSPDGIDGSV